MKRINISPRDDWQNIVEKQGLLFHTTKEIIMISDGDYRSPPKQVPQIVRHAYWDETACYSFDLNHIERIEKATNELHEMCLQAVYYVIDNNLYEEFNIPYDNETVNLIKRSWDEDWPSIYGRFDLCVDNFGNIKMLEYNADTPTSLLEAAIIQWYWLNDKFPNHDQFNSLHEKLIAAWKRAKGNLMFQTMHFAHMDDLEDKMTVGYLRETANQAGFNTPVLWVKEIGWSDKKQKFVDTNNITINKLFKLYPWEWIINEDFSRNLIKAVNNGLKIIEPPWKMILSNKCLLPLLWKMFPNNEYLLECYKHTPKNMKWYVKKPIFSREGANIQIVSPKGNVETSGDYGEEGFIYQKYIDIPDFNGYHPVIGSWVVDGEAAGMGIRESTGLITDNTSRFAPHYIE